MARCNSLSAHNSVIIIVDQSVTVLILTGLKCPDQNPYQFVEEEILIMQLEDVYEQLTAPFDSKQVGLKPQSVKDGQAMALPYINARTVMNRLDQVAGPSNWSDRYQVVAAGGKLAVRSEEHTSELQSQF